jgi:hypothetical protein
VSVRNSMVGVGIGDGLNGSGTNTAIDLYGSRVDGAPAANATEQSRITLAHSIVGATVAETGGTLRCPGSFRDDFVTPVTC